MTGQCPPAKNLGGWRSVAAVTRRTQPHIMSAEHEFPNTRWSVILEAQDEDSALRHRALEQICHTYWRPIYAFARGQGLAPSDAEDLTQDFLSCLLDKQAFEKVAANKGKLRAFLRVATKNHLRNHWRKASAQKRGGQATILSLDYEDAERRISAQIPDEDSPDRLFDRQWGLNLLNRTMERLERVYTSEGKGEVFAVLKDVIGVKSGGPSHRELAAQLGMSESGAGVAIHRLRKRYRRLLKEEIALTLDDESEEAVEQELQYLFGLFAS